MAFDYDEWKRKREDRKQFDELLKRSSISWEATHGYCKTCKTDVVVDPESGCCGPESALTGCQGHVTTFAAKNSYGTFSSAAKEKAKRKYQRGSGY
jgi:hypothetical protein